MTHMRFLLFLLLATSINGSCGPNSTSGTDDLAKPDASAACIDGATQCDGNSFMTCSSSQWAVTEQCVSTICNSTAGCVECNPSLDFCDGQTAYQCNEDGTRGEVITVCAGEDHCSGGTCSNLCSDAVESRSYLGCEYWAVDLDNAVDIVGMPTAIVDCALFSALQPGVSLIEDAQICMNVDSAPSGQCDGDGGCPLGYTCQTTDVCALDADHSPFAVVVSNPHAFAVDVVVENAAGHSRTTSVAAGAVAVIYPGELGFDDQSVTSTSISANAYRVTTNAPVVAYQFNPLDNVDVFSNDGSLLIPRHAFDTSYYAMTWATVTKRPNDGKDYAGYVTIAAWQDGTEITVTPSADVNAGKEQAAIAAGTPATFTLNAFDVLNLEAASDSDLTGTYVEVTGGDGTVAMFAGHEAVLILHDGASGWADHIEEMMLPTSTWGTEYAIARSKQRTDESDVVRILAQADDTAVSLTTGTCPTLNRGEFCELDIATDIEISSTKPVLVGHYLKSVSTATQNIGDPSLAIAVPVEQFRSTYTFLVPQEYTSQYISVVATMGASVTLDGVDVSAQFAAMGSNNRGAARIEMTPGQHNLECSGGCGLEVYGYSDAVSYLFAGGLDLEQIVID